MTKRRERRSLFPLPPWLLLPPANERYFLCVSGQIDSSRWRRCFRTKMACSEERGSALDVLEPVVDIRCPRHETSALGAAAE